ncbi:hypothetical protein EHF33_02420 [Deinococcus psychrotolerans]|uniref:Uncharacterized protein n=1 Tax=Deinococcus psychrotolerans TaxID=2489213 RepID=A0A3G8Y8P7_9DEIO|nr:hypothetical protein [Deinococcus psychrotolerans]AZI41742.1 hypothetical protein EHF33_02420 [Deinococcus psychrotolerans]
MRLLGIGLLGLGLSSLAASAMVAPKNASLTDETPIYVRQNVQTTLVSAYADGSKALELGCRGDRIYGQQDWNGSKIVASVLIFDPNIGKVTASMTMSKRDKRILEPETGKYSAVCESGTVVLRLGEGVKLIELK